MYTTSLLWAHIVQQGWWLTSIKELQRRVNIAKYTSNITSSVWACVSSEQSNRADGRHAGSIQMIFLFALAFVHWGSEEFIQPFFKGRQEDNAPSLPPPESLNIREMYETEEKETKRMARWNLLGLPNVSMFKNCVNPLTQSLQTP